MNMMKNILTIVLFLTLASCAAGGGKAGGSSYASRNIAGMDVAVWLPDAGKTPAPWPVLVFSHGFHGCNTQSDFLMKAFADSGYAVFAPNHADAGCVEGGSAAAEPAVPFADAANWTPDTYKDRGQDISKLLDALEKDMRYRDKKKFDWDHIGLVGHSLGGYTVLGVAGAWPTWKDQRIREERIQAVLALAPYTQPYVLGNTFHYVHAPVMYQSGSNDADITTPITKGKGAYDKTPAPKHYVEFEGADHFAWADKNMQSHKDIVRYSLGFLDHYLKNQPYPAGLAQKQPGIAHYREIQD